jgi:hypothetical protein
MLMFPLKGVANFKNPKLDIHLNENSRCAVVFHGKKFQVLARKSNSGERKRAAFVRRISHTNHG